MTAAYLNDPLWQSLTAMRIEPAGSRLTFVQRLARENGWSVRYAQRVMEEYRRFLYLSAKSDHPVTPSDAVDQAWHLHLTYSRHYWDILCGQILPHPLHHGPTAGGAHESRKYRNLYASTRERYLRVFGHAPPPDIWPGEEARFSHRFERVDRAEVFVVPKRPVFAVSAVAGAAVLAACSAVAATGTSTMAEDFYVVLGLMTMLLPFALLFGVSMAIAHWLRKRRLRRNAAKKRPARRKNTGDSCSSDSGSWDSGDTGMATAATGAAFVAGGGDFGGSGAQASWSDDDSDSDSDNGDSGSDSGGDSGGDSGCSGCSGCGGD